MRLSLVICALALLSCAHIVETQHGLKTTIPYSKSEILSIDTLCDSIPLAGDDAISCIKVVRARVR